MALKDFIYKIIGDPNEKQLKKLNKYIEKINSLEPEIESLPDENLKEKTDEFKRRLSQGEILEDILCEAFAVVRETSRRVLGMRHFDVQLMGALVLHQGRIAEMKTGEGKTLVATMPAYLNALEEKGVHIITVNDYLAKRDAEWMGEVYRFLGLEVGVITNEMNSEERKEAYNCDITYGTNNEFGFDYLRDNMALYKERLVQRELNFVILDEVDSILIDEARTPLIISGSAEKPKEMYKKMASFVPTLKIDEDYTVDEKAQSVMLTEQGVEKAENFLGVENLFDNENMELSHHLNQALKAKVLMKKDEDYVVQNGEVVIVDQFTGRLMHGRRYSDGLHQAIEAKENVEIEKESQTLASITFQNFFRMYNKISGMTGTAATEEDEFREIYGMDVVVIPTNKPLVREVLPDKIYKTEDAKFKGVVEDIVERYNKGQPVLVGTVSIEKSERLSKMLKKKGIPHQVLNAKHHEREAEIIKQAGMRGAVTIATNMAGRGTDIVLEEGVTELGGLHVIGTERHESRRVDNQLRGRSGRQGDPGSSQFYVSLEDDLMRLFGSDNIGDIMEKIGMDDDYVIDHPMITRAIENAQKKVEGRNFSIRKQILQFDDVMDEQRRVIYDQRRRVLKGEDLEGIVKDMFSDVIDDAIERYASENIYPEEWDLNSLLHYARQSFLTRDLGSYEKVKKITDDLEPGEAQKALKDYFMEQAMEHYKQREEELGEETMRELEKLILLRTVDSKWMDHINGMDELRQGIGLRAYGQKDPLMEYKYESYEMFQNMVAAIREDVVRLVQRVQVKESPGARRNVASIESASGHESAGHGVAANSAVAAGGENQSKPQPVKRDKKIGRNEPCPCGSNKKYKKCCGRPA